MVKSETLSLRISPEAKALLAKAAALEHRSNSNLVEYLILTFCKERGIEPDTAGTSSSSVAPSGA